MSKKSFDSRRYIRIEEDDIRPATLSLLVAISVIGALFYAQYFWDPSHRGNILPYMIMIVTESFLVFQALIALWTIIASTHDPRDYKYYNAQKDLLVYSKMGDLQGKSGDQSVHSTPLFLKGKPVSVDVFITVYGEPLEVVEKTATAAKDIRGRHTTYILDDGKSDEAHALAQRLGIHYIRRENNAGAKAGNINNALRLTLGEYFVIFDADHVPEPSYLYETMPFFHDPQVAFVQTPQYYVNLHSPIAKGAGYAQSLFYRFICPGKNRFNAAFCCGTNVVFRRQAVMTIGGIYDKSNSEDIWTSLLLHEKGYKSVFISNILAKGHAPDTIKSYTKQQLRWATGGFEILFRHNPLKQTLSIDQKIQYLTTAMFYLSGVATGLLLLLPPLYIFFRLSPIAVHAGFQDWIIHYSAFYVLQLFVALYCMRGIRLETIVLATGSFPIYLRALTNVILNKPEKWHVTGQKIIDSPFNYIVPQLLIFLFLLFATTVGIIDIIDNKIVSMAVVWSLLSLLVFGYYLSIAIGEKRYLSREEKITHLQTASNS